MRRTAVDSVGRLPYIETMTHHHHHGAGHGHPPRTASPSLLRMSAVERLAAALAVAAALWLATWWAMSGS